MNDQELKQRATELSKIFYDIMMTQKEYKELPEQEFRMLIDYIYAEIFAHIYKQKYGVDKVAN
jgi:hypothetical protein